MMFDDDTSEAFELPANPYERVLAYQEALVSFFTGGSMGGIAYGDVRRELTKSPQFVAIAPDFIRACREEGSLWSFAKTLGGYEPRRLFLREQFVPLLDILEAGGSPADSLIADGLSKLDEGHIRAVWDKALARCHNDPAGAITAARSLLETACKIILDAAEGGPHYSASDDLPKLYRTAAEHLSLAPSQHSEEAFRRILGGCTSVVEGLGTLRNRVGDAHGQGRRPVRPLPRHALLEVNLSGAMALFLADTWEERQQR